MHYHSGFRLCFVKSVSVLCWGRVSASSIPATPPYYIDSRHDSFLACSILLVVELLRILHHRHRQWAQDNVNEAHGIVSDYRSMRRFACGDRLTTTVPRRRWGTVIVFWPIKFTNWNSLTLKAITCVSKTNLLPNFLTRPPGVQQTICEYGRSV